MAKRPKFVVGLSCVAGTSANPGGNEPAASVTVYGGVPPPMPKTVFTCEPTTTSPRAAVGNPVISDVDDSAFEIIVKFFTTAVAELAAVTVAINVPVAVGVPEIAPVEALIVRPAGNPV